MYLLPKKIKFIVINDLNKVVLTTVLIGSVQKIERTTRNLLTYNYNCSFYQIINYEVITQASHHLKTKPMQCGV